MLFANAFKRIGDTKKEATPIIKPIINIFKLLMFKTIYLLSFHDKTHKVTRSNVSVIAVPKATPKAGLSLKITKPNKSDNPILIRAALATETK